MFQSTSLFFAAHATLEDAVIAEADGSPANPAAIERSRTIMGETAETLNGALDHLQTNRATLIEQGSDSWHADYFTRQQESLETLARLSAELVDALAAPSINDAAETASLQQSLWHEAVNHRVRTLSINYVETLVETLQHHIAVVIETNKAT